ncbi:hypothetical protein HMPREF3226_00798 [Prevotella corporis]|uniref:Uncharacterized protein n=1 Tax=Prevotella corporis TaxID=28128 RepID=A0A133QEZ9_9BACT|nr:hypothetical protein HMPREF3226_00798 [Prevotella corporis]
MLAVLLKTWQTKAKGNNGENAGKRMKSVRKRFAYQRIVKSQ